jgi:hypothetical protein
MSIRARRLPPDVRMTPTCTFRGAWIAELAMRSHPGIARSRRPFYRWVYRVIETLKIAGDMMQLGRRDEANSALAQAMPIAIAFRVAHELQFPLDWMFPGNVTLGSEACVGITSGSNNLRIGLEAP